MSQKTPIQWTDSTVNPYMGCAGCELFPAAGAIATALDRAISEVVTGWKRGDSNALLVELCQAAHDRIPERLRRPGHSPKVTSTNIWHLRKEFGTELRKEQGAEAADIASRVIEEQVSCYAAKLHLNKGLAITNPQRKECSGYAPVFNKLTAYPGRGEGAAGYKDLLGPKREPWKGTLARMIFVSDMGDAFSKGDKETFDFLEREVMAPITSEKGRRHLWQWLTKRPHIMARFAKRIGGFPENVMAMTTLTSSDYHA